MRLRALAVLIGATALTVALPLAGLTLAGHPVAPYLNFPPRAEYVAHAAFSWRAFTILCIPVLAAAALYWIAIARTQPRQPAPVSQRFPWWGWLGLALMTVGWAAAWIDGLVPPEWRRQTFALLWLGYILMMNGLIYRRAGRSPLTHGSGLFVALFAVSAVFWWLFEYLNQFARNWYYSGVHARDGWDYFLQASLPFSTVLPAVLSTWAWLGRFARLDTVGMPALRGRRIIAWLALAAGTFGLTGIGLWPEALFPMLWIAPLLVVLGLQHLLLGATILTPLTRGDWRPLLQPALAALVCGLLWELWNFGSLAKWHYSIPYVQRFHLFEMPLLGYAGYLPFGLECAAVIDLVATIVTPKNGPVPIAIQNAEFSSVRGRTPSPADDPPPADRP